MTCPCCHRDPLPDRLDWHLVSVHGWEVSRATREYEAGIERIIKRIDAPLHKEERGA